MALDLSEYKAQLEADPNAENTGPWYAKGNINHNGENFGPGRKLPTLKNSEVAQLLDVNAITSVGPAEGATQAAPADPAGQQFDENGNPIDATGAPTGTDRLDENGNPVQ
jgi:hypothetical protein